MNRCFVLGFQLHEVFEVCESEKNKETDEVQLSFIIS